MNFFANPEPLDPNEILPPNVLAARSRDLAQLELRVAKDDLAKAEAQLADAQERYTESDWTGANVIAKAEEAYETAFDAVEAAEVKLHWEKTGKWKPASSAVSAIARTKYLLAQVDWASLFQFRNPTKKKKK